MPISAVAAGVSIASAVGNGINQAVNSGGASSAGGASGGTGGGGIQANEQKFYGSDASNPYYGVHVGTTPLSGKQAPQPKDMTAERAPEAAKAENPRATPTQSDGTADAKNDINNVWADRLSKYLDYNTRALG